ncbi:PadR family transcriptional regulator [Dictyobacter kobayashii]|uniref:Transcription regulator PadR N-terminal domain-containing protein n=1 Tax=Dictyobacter kobayashii TaxID=2014872 RepID=A0A402AV23_9CHLR|nr:PadR family transcriptional regulator [Dictyobacter kobayashii]GCE22935.1 hypothetical protein KDK_67350 [Dictyobacter kobayashii]
MKNFGMNQGPWFGQSREFHHTSRGQQVPYGEGPAQFEHRGHRERWGEPSAEFGHHEHREHRGPRGRRGDGFGFGEFGPREHRGPHGEGHGGPEHRGPRGRRGERGGPRIGRGDVRSATLLLLAENPSHGYQIIQQVGERSGGLWQPSPGSVYPALQMLEDEGLIKAEEQEGRRVFQLTEAGQAYVAEHKDELSTVWKSVTDTVDNSQLELQDLFHQLGKAVRTVAQEGTPTQIAAARELLGNTRRQLYLILASEDTTTQD